MDEILDQPQVYAVGEYLLVLRPHEELWNRVTRLKQEFAEKYECVMANQTKPQITLVKFTQYEMMEERLLNRLRHIAMALPAIKIELKDFGSYPSHTIYINVTSKVPVVNMVKELRQAQQLMKLNNDNKPYFITAPQLTIARKLLPWQYEQAWLEYSHRHFTGRFIAQQLVLLKRNEGGKAYRVAENFALQNMPVVTKQGNLFA